MIEYGIFLGFSIIVATIGFGKRLKRSNEISKNGLLGLALGFFLILLGTNSMIFLADSIETKANSNYIPFCTLFFGISQCVFGVLLTYWPNIAEKFYNWL